MIKSITVRPEFDVASGMTDGYGDRQAGYPLPSLPVEHQLDTRSNFVLIIGDNGVGKTTLLERLADYKFTHNGRQYSMRGRKFFDLEYDGNKEPVVGYISRVDSGTKEGLINRIWYELQDGELKHRRDGIHKAVFSLMDDIGKTSTGEFQRKYIEDVLELFTQRPEHVIAFDQPEDAISLRNREWLVKVLSDYAFTNDRQIFIATHEPGFLKVPGALVINLDDIPATVTHSEKFDINSYRAPAKRETKASRVLPISTIYELINFNNLPAWIGKNTEEDREGVKLRVSHLVGSGQGEIKLSSNLEGGIQRIEVTSWPGGLTYYTDQEMRDTTQIYTPKVVHEDPETGSKGSRVGVAFPVSEKHLEEVVHSIVAISRTIGEFGGFDETGYRKTVEFANYYLEELGTDFRTVFDPARVQAAIKVGYLREDVIEGKPVYFPTEKSVRAMCNTRFEDMLYCLALHTGSSIGTGYRIPGPVG